MGGTRFLAVLAGSAPLSVWPNHVLRPISNHDVLHAHRLWMIQMSVQDFADLMLAMEGFLKGFCVCVIVCCHVRKPIELIHFPFGRGLEMAVHAVVENE